MGDKENHKCGYLQNKLHLSILISIAVISTAAWSVGAYYIAVDINAGSGVLSPLDQAAVRLERSTFYLWFVLPFCGALALHSSFLNWLFTSQWKISYRWVACLGLGIFIGLAIYDLLVIPITILIGGYLCSEARSTDNQKSKGFFRWWWVIPVVAVMFGIAAGGNE